MKEINLSKAAGELSFAQKDQLRLQIFKSVIPVRNLYRVVSLITNVHASFSTLEFFKSKKGTTP